MKNERLQSLFVLSMALAAGACGPGTSSTGDLGSDMARAGDMAMMAAGDMAVAAGDMAMAAGDMVVAIPKPSPVLLLNDVATTIVVQGMPIPARLLVAAAFNSDPTKGKPHDFDDRPNMRDGELGCFADHYDATKGDLPVPDMDMGKVTLKGYAALTGLDMMMVPAEINCAFSALTMGYACGFGPLTNGMPGPPTNTVPVPAMSKPIPPGSMISAMIEGKGNNGSLDAKSTAATEELSVMENLSLIKYDPAANGKLTPLCPDGVMGACPPGAHLVLVQLTAASVPPGMPGFPGADFGTMNCVAPLAAGAVTIPKDGVKAMFGDSVAITTVTTMVVRGAIPAMPMDSKMNVAQIVVARGVLGVAAK